MALNVQVSIGSASQEIIATQPALATRRDFPSQESDKKGMAASHFLVEKRQNLA
jgi:hypothetical protein